MHAQRHHLQPRKRTLNGVNALSVHAIPLALTNCHRRSKSTHLAQPQLRTPKPPRREQPLEPSPLNQGYAANRRTSQVAAAPASTALHGAASGAAPMAQIRYKRNAPPADSITQPSIRHRRAAQAPLWLSIALFLVAISKELTHLNVSNYHRYPSHFPFCDRSNQNLRPH